MKKKKNENLIPIVIFFMLIIGPTISWFFLYDKYDFDIGEKRLKATLSETIDLGTITGDIERYYNDRLPYRSILISFKNSFDAFIERPYKNVERMLLNVANLPKLMYAKNQADIVDGEVKYFMDDAVDIYYDHGLTIDEFDPYDPDAAYPMKYSENQNVIIGHRDWLFLNYNNLPLYTGELGISETEMEEYVDMLEEIDDMCKKVNKKFMVLICPEKEEIYPEYMPKMDIKDEKERTLYIKDYIEANTDLTYIYPKMELLNAKNKYLVYRKYDSHWNYIAGLIANNKILEALGRETHPVRSYEVWKVDMIDNDLVLYGNMNQDALPKTFEYLVNYKPDIKVREMSVPGVKEKVSGRIESDADNDERLFFVGDSYSHAITRFIYKDFKETYLNIFSEFDKIPVETMVEELEKSDVILIALVERNEKTVMPDVCHTLKKELEMIYGKFN